MTGTPKASKALLACVLPEPMPPVRPTIHVMRSLYRKYCLIREIIRSLKSASWISIIFCLPVKQELVVVGFIFCFAGIRIATSFRRT